MANERVTLQTGYVLHRRDYRETSLLIDMFTLEHGRLTLLGKAARRQRVKQPGLFEPFRRTAISWVGYGDLPTVTHAEFTEPAVRLISESLFCGFYLNELLTRLLPARDPHPELFERYVATLRELAQGFSETALRRFEFELLGELGFGLNLATDALSGEDLMPEQWYDYRMEVGPVRSTPQDGTFLGERLLAMGRRELTDTLVLKDAKRLLRRILNHQLGGQALVSRALFREAVKSPRDAGLT